MVIVVLIECHFYFARGNFAGTEIIDAIAQQNEIDSDSVPRISVDMDWADGLISR